MIDPHVSKILRKRRSVFPKQFNGKSITKEHVIEILKNANQAPTHKITEPWFFKIFTKNSKNKLKKKIIETENYKYNSAKLDKINVNFQKTSHIICVCMRRNEIIPEWEEIAATSMAVQNIWISCVNSQIGGYWSTPKWISKIHDFLNLKENERCLGLFYLGIFDTLTERKLKRKNILEDITWFE